MVAENEHLKLRVADLEHRIYELTESPDQLAKSLIQDVDLLLTIPYRDNLELAQAMIGTFKISYPGNKYLIELERQEIEIENLLQSMGQGKSFASMNSLESMQNDKSMDLKVQFGVQVSEKRSGFINVELSAQNLSNKAISNVWIKATLVDKNGGSYGITQDFFFNRLNPFDLKYETLSWEYVQLHNIGGIVLKQLRYSENRQTRMMEEHECISGQGNVKIFLEF